MKTENNSKWQIGSTGWRNTLLGQIKHIGEFLKEKTPDENMLRSWGNTLFDNSSDLIEYHESYKLDKTVVGFEDETIDKLIKNAFRYELTDAEIKSYLIDFLRSYRWHVIERSQSIGASAIHEANLENKL